MLAPILGLGFALGMAHATDADHVVAVSTMVSSQRRLGSVGLGAARDAITSAARIGTLWGIGHTLTILIAGGVMVGSKLVLPARVSMGFELLVSVMLVALGASTLFAGRHQHAPSAPRGLRSLGVGMVHGLAGSGAIALAVLSQTHSAATGVGYLACFGVGTLAGMLVLTTLMSLPFIVTAKHRDLSIWIRRLAGVASVGLGLVLFVKIGFIDGCLLA